MQIYHGKVFLREREKEREEESGKKKGKCGIAGWDEKEKGEGD